MNELSYILQKFVEFDKAGLGFIEFPTFCKILGLEETTLQAKHIFSFFDRNQSGTIDFRELALGLAYCSTEVNNEEKRRLAFNLFDTDGDGYISWQQFEKLFKIGEDNLEPGRDHVFSRQTKKDFEGVLEKLKSKAEELLERSDDVYSETKEDPGIPWEVFNQLALEEPRIVNHVLYHNNTGVAWNIKANMNNEGVKHKAE